MDFCLHEGDIPGAKLPKPVDECTCAILRRWLLCRGAKTSGKLAELRRRVKHYVDHKLDAKYLRDPDGGIHLLKKKAEAGLLDNTTPTEVEGFPAEGYSTSLSKIPNVTFGTVWKFMVDSMEWKKELSTAKPLVKGYNFFMSKHVLSTYHQNKDTKHYIKSQVLSSMKKKMVYSCYIKLSSLGYVLSAKCGCPAGVDGRCNHVCATLFYLDSVYKINSKQCTDESSCTSKPCKWNIPSKRKGQVEPIASMKFRKHDYNKVNKGPISSKNVSESQGVTPEPVDDEKSKVPFKKMEELEKKTGRVIGWCHILPQDLPDLPEQNRYAENELISPIKITESPISINGIKERMERIKKKLFIDDTTAAEIEKQTKDQSSNSSWHIQRQYRITASKSAIELLSSKTPHHPLRLLMIFCMQKLFPQNK